MICLFDGKGGEVKDDWQWLALVMINGSMMDGEELTGEEKVAKLMAWDACHKQWLMDVLTGMKSSPPSPDQITSSS